MSAWKTDTLGVRVHACAYVRYLCVRVLPSSSSLNRVFCVCCTYIARNMRRGSDLSGG